MHPKNISISDYTYDLPGDRIAIRPVTDRGGAKLLMYNAGEITETVYSNISALIPSGSLMILNNTKVVEARLFFQKITGGVIEIFCLEPHEQYADITTAMSQTGSVQWLCLIGGASKWKQGLILEREVSVGQKIILISAAYIEKRNDCFVVELTWNDQHISFAELLHHAGTIPLPPYIKRNADTEDTTRYQTVYANADGSVAAPTAGLHFTGDIFSSLHTKGIKTDFITLHVGAGTFKPVKAATMLDHEMHAEFIEVSSALITQIRDAADAPIITVGTTSIRTVESLYWLGCKLLAFPEVFEQNILTLSQWEPYELYQYKVCDALNALLGFLNKKNKSVLLAKTQIIIAPGYNFKIATALITNFHQPSSTLLLLVAAFIGDDWKKVYNHALNHHFRFLSYGDGSLLWRNK